MSDRARIEELLVQWMDAAPDRREAVLDELCEADPDLAEPLRRRVERLHHLGFFDGPGSAEAPQPGHMLGGFRLVRPLGGGGMGIVYEAQQVSLGNRRVALKLIRPEYVALPRAKARFQREALLASRLDHPGICAVHEIGEHDGMPFLVMQFVEGEDLSQRIQRVKSAADERREKTPLTLSEDESDAHTLLLGFFEKAARALHAAHESGLVHRDVKPGNLMVQPNLEPCLLDFGLAMIPDDELQGGLTMTGDTVGTPVYMSPEQISPNGRVLDRRTDIYSLAATLYECLTLKTPFEGSTREALYRRILTEPPEDPRRRCPGISKDLATVLATALAKDRNRRYETAEKFADDLQRVLRRQPILARPPSPWLRTGMWVRRNPVVASLTSAVTVALLVTAWLLSQVQDLARHSQALALAGRSAIERPLDANVALHLAVRALELDRSEDAETQLYSAIAAQRLVARVAIGAPVEHVRAHPSGFLVGARDGRLWMVASDGTVRATSGPLQPVSSFAVRDDGSGPEVFAGTVAGRVYAWRPTTGAEPRELLPACGKAMTVLEVTEDGSRLLCGSRDRTIRVFDLSARRPIFSTRHATGVTCGEFVRGSAEFVIGGQGGAIAYYNTNGDVLRRFEHPGLAADKDLHRVRFLPAVPPTSKEEQPSPRRIVSVSASDNTKRAWLFDVDGDSRRPLVKDFTRVNNAILAPGGGMFVTTAGGGNVRVFDVATGRLRSANLHQADAVSVAYAPAGNLFATGSFDRTVRVWDARCMERARFTGHRQVILDLAFSTDNRLIASGGLDGELRIWRVTEAAPTFTGPQVAAFFFVTPGLGQRTAYVACSDGRRWRYDCTHATAEPLTAQGLFMFGPVALHPGGRWLLGTAGGALERLDLSSGERSLTGREHQHGSKVPFIGFYPDGQRLLTVIMGRAAPAVPPGFRIWRFADGVATLESTRRLPEIRGGLNHGALLGGGRYIALAAKDGYIHVYDAENPSGDRVARLECHPGDPVRTLSAAGDRLAAGTRDGHVCVFDVGTPPYHRIRKVRAHVGGRIWSVRYTGGHLLSASGDGSVGIWSRDGVLQRRIRPIKGEEIHDAWIPPAADYILTSNSAGSLRRLYLDPARLLEHGRSLCLPLDPDEERQFGGLLGR